MLERFLFRAKTVALCRKAHINPRQSDIVKIESKAPLGSLFSDLCPQIKVRNRIRLLRCLLGKVEKLHQFRFANRLKEGRVTLLFVQFQKPANADRFFRR